MARVWYGSIQNRMEENRMFVDEIKVGTGVTEYYWSDRRAYEVIEVKDQKHVTVREYDHRLRGEAYSNDWELISNPDKPEKTLERRGDRWYWTTTVTKDFLDENDTEKIIWLVLNGFDSQKILEKGSQTKRRLANVSFGTAEYYYDYSF